MPRRSFLDGNCTATALTSRCLRSPRPMFEARMPPAQTFDGLWDHWVPGATSLHRPASRVAAKEKVEFPSTTSRSSRTLTC